MKPELRQAFEAEMAAAARLYEKGQLDQAFKHLEVAHVLGQRYVIPHAKSHWLMLKVGMKRRSLAQVIGQGVRIVFGVLGSAVGIVPTGNTGGTNISMFKRLPIDQSIHKLVE
jgi:hypothetical protein